MTTVTAVKRALEETLVIGVFELSDNEILTLQALANSPTLLTLIANRLSDRGEAGNAANRANLAHLRNMSVAYHADQVEQRLALDWAIDQLTPPTLATPAKPCTMGVGCDQTGHCFARANGQPERCGRL
jgi:hypothetical protein